jgi:hypothetical protein
MDNVDADDIATTVVAVDAAVEVGLGGLQQVGSVMQSQASKHACILRQARSDFADLIEITFRHDFPSPRLYSRTMEDGDRSDV